MGVKLVEYDNVKGEYAFFCPGCQSLHSYSTITPNDKGAKWNFNNNMELPTFTPSLLVRFERKAGVECVCHLYLTDGKLQYLGDCTHDLKGKTIDLPEIGF